MASSKKKIAQELRERTVESFLDFLILVMLAKNPSMRADDLMDFVHRKFKVLLSLGIARETILKVKKQWF